MAHDDGRRHLFISRPSCSPREITDKRHDEKRKQEQKYNGANKGMGKEASKLLRALFLHDSLSCWSQTCFWCSTACQSRPHPSPHFITQALSPLNFKHPRLHTQHPFLFLHSNYRWLSLRGTARNYIFFVLLLLFQPVCRRGWLLKNPNYLACQLADLLTSVVLHGRLATACRDQRTYV